MRKLRGFSGTTVTVNGTHCLNIKWFCRKILQIAKWEKDNKPPEDITSTISKYLLE